MAPSTDAELLRRSRRDPAAFDALFRRHAGSLHRRLSRQIGDHLAEEVVAETFARAWAGRRRFRDDRGGTALPWLSGIAANVLRESARGRRVDSAARERLRLTMPTAAAELDERACARLDAAAAAERLLATLSPGERHALHLRVVDDLSFQAIAERLDIRPAAARLRVSRAMRRLRATQEDNR